MFSDGTYRGLTSKETRGDEPIPLETRLYKPDNILSQGPASLDQTLQFQGKNYSPGINNHWKAKFPDGMKRLAISGHIHVAKNSIQYVRYADDFTVKSRNNIWTDTLTGQYTEDKIYVVQTNTKIVERCLLMTTDPGDLVLDPTCGSGTTAYVAEQWGRRWITIDTSRVAIALARTRLMAARYPYFLLADSYEGKKKERELNPLAFPGEDTEKNPGESSSGGDLKRGFVYKRVPHVTLKSIANNEEVDVIHEKFQPRLEELRGNINKAAGQKWEEWEIPREPPVGTQYIAPLNEYWQTRQTRQKEIDASIARRADTEFLYDQPYEEPRRIRVSGPFTVESLSPHRVLAPDDPATAFREDTLNTRDFAGMIIENLRTSGVQNAVKKERLKFDRLEPYAGTWIHAAGEYTEKGNSKRVAVSIGPELGTVGPEQVKEAAKEAVSGIGFDLLIVCGFAFDPHVSEEAKRYGKLTVLPAHMNPDLAMGDALLKKTGAGNLFMVFGEPDLEIKKKEGKLSVHLIGLDVYDPTTGEVRSNSTDDIACWFIDTDYNEETFIVRQAYFTGADQPYEKLQRALRAEIDEAAWSALYSTTSYPFEAPKTGKIAVKVINHYGDEVLKVYEVK
jgi:adenine-specific DNA-methyltransferase